MTMQFKRATKERARLRAALIGPAGSGKTYTALALAQHLGQRVAVIDTEHGSASKYADIFAFDALELQTFAPRTYVEAIHAAEEAGYDVLVIDSLSHAWMGKGGALEMVDAVGKRMGGGNSFAAWRDVTPQHNALVEAMIACKAHLLVTMRSKTEYVLEEDSRGKKVPRKVGMAPVQRDGLEYEFDVVGEITSEHEMLITKTRCPALTDQSYRHPGADVAKIMRGWLEDGAAAPAKPQLVPAPVYVPTEAATALYDNADYAKAIADASEISDVVEAWRVHRDRIGKLSTAAKKAAWTTAADRAQVITKATGGGSALLTAAVKKRDLEDPPKNDGPPSGGGAPTPTAPTSEDDPERSAIAAEGNSSATQTRASVAVTRWREHIRGHSPPHLANSWADHRREFEGPDYDAAETAVLCAIMAFDTYASRDAAEALMADRIEKHAAGGVKQKRSRAA